MTRLYLIRHGQAHCNVPPYGVVAGMKGDAGLTPLGVRQAERLRDRLAATGEIAADALIASPLRRARQTAEIVAPALGLPIVTDDAVQELDFGELDGLPWEEVKDSLGDFRVDPFRPLGPGAENWPRFQLRVAEALDRIAREHAGKTVVIVCHGGVIDATFNAFFGINTLMPGPAELFTHNTSITLWERDEEAASPRWRLVRYNDDLHARDLGADERLGWVRLAPEQRPAPSVQSDGTERASTTKGRAS